jgi:hypothetical protein
MKLNGPVTLLIATLLTVTGVWLTPFRPLLEAQTPSSQDHAPIPAQLDAADRVVLSGDVDAEAHRLAALVLDAAISQDVPVVRTDFEVRYVDQIEKGAFIAGETDGHVIVLGRNVAEHDLFLLHELAHAVVGIDHGHGEPWRSVYVASVCEALGERRARRELRRIEWVYDKSYLDADSADGLRTGEEVGEHLCHTGWKAGARQGRRCRSPVWPTCLSHRLAKASRP